VLAKNADDEFVDACPTLKDCSASLKDKQDEATRLARISDVLLISGGALVTGGVVWRVLTSGAPGTNRQTGAERFVLSASGRF
jgi:hypothetical protein